MTISTRPLVHNAGNNAGNENEERSGLEPSPSEPSLDAGTVIGNYTVRRFVASGGFGSVYRATDDDGQQVAIKVLHPELQALGDPIIRFVREAEVLSRIEHPHVVRTLDSGFLPDGRTYIAMELLSGTDLDEYIERSGQLSLPRTLELLAPLCGALTAAHDLGIVHRDVKASNVFIDNSGDSERVVLLDFGIAKIVEEGGTQLTSSRMALGTPTCIAPEQIRGADVDQRTDVYALGALAFRMLTGQAPFQGSSHTVLHYMHLHSRRPSLCHVGNLGPGIDDVIRRAMATRAADRYSTAAEFLAALTAAGEQRGQNRRAKRRSLREETQAIGVYVDVRMEQGESSDEILDAVDSILDQAALEFANRGFVPAFEGSNATLFASVMPAELEAQARKVRETILAAADLFHAVEPRLGDLTVNVCVHRAGVILNGDQVRGGELLRLDRWTPETAVGVCFSADAIDGVELESQPVPGSDTLRQLLPMPSALKAGRDEGTIDARTRHQQMMAQLGRQTASLVHDLRSPVTALLACITEVLNQAQQELCEDYQEALEDALEAANHMKAMTRDVLQSSSMEAYKEKAKVVRVSDAVDRAVNLTRAEVRKKARVHVSHSDEGFFMGSLGQLTQVLTNLLVNAAHAIESDGDIFIRTQVSQQGRVQIAVRDTGCGISETQRQRIFEPYFTTKGIAEGTGLGLATVLATVNEHGGSVSVDSSPGTGTCFTISLPSAPQEQHAAGGGL